jgi:hypothetical protein
VWRSKASNDPKVERERSDHPVTHLDGKVFEQRVHPLREYTQGMSWARRSLLALGLNEFPPLNVWCQTVEEGIAVFLIGVFPVASVREESSYFLFGVKYLT